MNLMQTALVYLKGVGPERARLLKEELQLRTYQDLLHFFPNRYIDRSRFYLINKLPQNNAEIQIKGQITSVAYIQQKRGKRMIASFEDETGSIELVWFQGHKWIRDQLKMFFLLELWSSTFLEGLNWILPTDKSIVLRFLIDSRGG